MLTTCLAVDGVDLPQEGGYVRYAFTLTNGVKDVPANSVLDFTTTTPGIAMSNKTCQLSTPGDANVGSAGTAGQLQATAVLTCTVDVLVTHQHAQVGFIPTFDTVAAYSSTGTDAAVFYIPPISTGGDVPVHTGSIVVHNSTAVVTAGNNNYITGEL